MEAKVRGYTYRSAVRWTGEKRGVCTTAGKPSIEVATPPEFKGHPGIWSPEDLFVSSVNACVMMTFLSFAERAGLPLAGYESEAEGKLEFVDGGFQFTAVTVKPRVLLRAGADPGKARELMDRAEKYCLVSRSVKSRVSVEASIEEGTPGAA
ncbi:MAG TPA: OsmC family protein [candidate division Zixibacteria bacterium]|nr:OsmC family protein [candidate division Zixibacteria bacterium]